VIDETAAELRRIALASTDATGYFAALYSRVTSRIGAAIRAGTFADGPALDAFATRFATFYVDAFREPSSRPRSWAAAWDVATDSRLLIVQHLLLGINAHVNHDLPLAVVAAADERGDLASIRPDFDAVNDVLAATYVDVVADLDRVSRWVNRVARLGADRAFNFSLRRARAQAWSAATRIHPLDVAARQRAEAELDRVVPVLAYLITRPPPIVRPLLYLARRLEERDVGTVVTALLGDSTR
jgi:hypothetical protein